MQLLGIIDHPFQTLRERRRPPAPFILGKFLNHQLQNLFNAQGSIGRILCNALPDFSMFRFADDTFGYHILSLLL